jgi:hypothetical protein
MEKSRFYHGAPFRPAVERFDGTFDFPAGGVCDPSNPFGVTVLTAFGACSVAAMMVCYALESRAPAYTLAFAVACVAASAYGWLAGTWPFGVVEAIWAVVALRKWRLRSAQGNDRTTQPLA